MQFTRVFFITISKNVHLLPSKSITSDLAASLVPFGIAFSFILFTSFSEMSTNS